MFLWQNVVIYKQIKNQKIFPLTNMFALQDQNGEGLLVRHYTFDFIYVNGITLISVEKTTFFHHVPLSRSLKSVILYLHIYCFINSPFPSAVYISQAAIHQLTTQHPIII